MYAVTTRPRAWRVAAAPAHASMSFMISPPWTLPYGFASDGSIVCVMIVFEPETGLPWVTGESYGVDPSATRILSAMSVLSREELRAMCAGDPPLVEGIEPDVQLQTNGVDLRVERIQRLSSPG